MNNLALNVYTEENKSKNKCVILDREIPNFQKPKRSKTGGCVLGGGANAISDEMTLNIMEYVLNRTNGTSRKTFNIRNYAIICFSFNTALRCGDILSLKLSDVIDNITKEIKDEFMITEEKTKKSRVVFINCVMNDALKRYLETDRLNYKDNLDEPLFCSRQKNSKTCYTNELRPITTQMYNKVLSDAKKALNIEPKIKLSSHSGRKSFARGIYDSTPDEEKQHVLVLISNILNHSNIETTMIYLNIRKDEIRNLIDKRNMGLKFER